MIRKKLLYCGQNYDIMDKTIVLYGELWNFDLRRKKNMVGNQKLRNFYL